MKKKEPAKRLSAEDDLAYTAIHALIKYCQQREQQCEDELSKVPVGRGRISMCAPYIHAYEDTEAMIQVLGRMPVRVLADAFREKAARDSEMASR